MPIDGEERYMIYTCWSHGSRDWVYTIGFAYIYILHIQLMNYICFHWCDLSIISCIHK